MAVLSIDLAYKTYRDIGAVILSREADTIRVDPIGIPLTGKPDPERLAVFLLDYCDKAAIRLLLLDGPQGWKAQGNGLEYSRVCEKKLNTPAKTGLPGSVKPANYRPFVEFSIAVFDRLSQGGFVRLPSVHSPLPSGPLAIESFPLSAWRSLAITALPAKSKAKPNDLIACLNGLRALLPLRIPPSVNHDELQATVAGIAGLVLETGVSSGCVVSGVEPVCEGGFWREGFIVNAVAQCAAALSSRHG